MIDIYKTSPEDHIDANEMALYVALMAYRASKGLPSIPLSKGLTITASRHALDLVNNGMDEVSRHSWSDAKYNPSDSSTTPAITAAPQRLGTGYPGAGYEILMTSMPSTLLSESSTGFTIDLFINSAPHRALIENTDGWERLEWKAVGISIHGAVASIWFGVEVDPTGAPTYITQDTPIVVAPAATGNMAYGGSAQNDVFIATNEGRASFDATGGYDIFVAGQGAANSLFRGVPSDYTFLNDDGSILVTDKVVGRDDVVRLVNFRASDMIFFYADGKYEVRTVAELLPSSSTLKQYNPVSGTGGGDILLGTAGNDFVALGNGADTYRFGGGTDIVAGGAGFDVIQFARSMAAYQFSTSPKGYVVTGSEGSVSFTDVEIMVFSDRVVAVSKPTLFNEDYYLAMNPDVASAITRGALTTGLSHWEAYGRNEGRQFTAWFDADFYLSHNPDVAAAVQAGWTTAWSHYLHFGAKEGRDPSAIFDVSKYLDANADVKAAGVPALEHWLNYGWAEGRTASPVDGYWG